MKETKDWDEDYLLNFTSGEYDWIEVKDSRKLDFTIAQTPKSKPVSESEAKNELSKQLSAFANSGGGTLIYGLEDPKVGAPYKIDSFGGVSLNIRNATKEWLEDIIPNLTDFRLNKFNVYVLTNKGNPNSQIAPDKGIFLIDIPSSEQAPHQANDSKYYARVGGKSRPIPHQFVMDIIGRAKYPKMELFCEISSNTKTGFAILNFTCKNVGKIFANYVNGEIHISDNLYKKEPTIYSYLSNFMGGTVVRSFPIENTELDVVGIRTDIVTNSGYKELTTQRYKPVLPNLSFRRQIELNAHYTKLGDYRHESISWEIYADNAPPLIGQTTIGGILNGELREFKK